MVGGAVLLIRAMHAHHNKIRASFRRNCDNDICRAPNTRDVFDNKRSVFRSLDETVKLICMLRVLLFIHMQ